MKAVAALVALAAAGALAADAPPKLYPLAASALMLDVAAAGGALVAVGERGFILRSTDGTVWQQVASPATNMLTAVFMGDGGSGWAVGHDTAIVRTSDGGASWSLANAEPELETPLFDVWFENGSHGLAIGAFGLLKETTNGGATWEERRIGEEELHLYAIAAAADGTLYVAGEAGALFRSADRGTTWEQLESPYEGSFFGVLPLNDGGVLAYGLRGNLYRSDDRGDTWTPIDAGTEATLLGGTQRADGSVVIVGLSGAVLRSADGRSFTAAALADREAMSGVRENAGTLLVFGEKGVHPLPPVPGS